MCLQSFVVVVVVVVVVVDVFGFFNRRGLLIFPQTFPQIYYSFSLGIYSVT